MAQKLSFRRSVAAILQDGEGRILIGQRSGCPGAWQFPQGGVDKGETDKQALYREVLEEIGVKNKLYDIKDRKNGYRYTFPNGRVKHGKYHGQEQVYFLCSFRGSDEDIQLDYEIPEFDQFRWIRPGDFDLGWVPGFKKDVYRAVFRDFFGVTL